MSVFLFIYFFTFQNIAASLINPVQSEIKNWQKENFHKSSISSSIKEVKNFDSEFENAQKTWYKQFKQVNKCKKDYFHACKVVRSLQVQVQNAKNEPFGTPEQVCVCILIRRLISYYLTFY